MLLNERVAIVTGGAEGIGKGIALKFAAEGCSVIIADIGEAEGEKTAKEISGKNRKGLFVKCDVTDYRSVNDMVKGTVAEFGGVDILVNNAGGILGMTGVPIEDITEEQWTNVIDLNLKSQFLCCQAVTKYMKERRYGKIINISSIGAVCPPASVIAYHAAKGGVLGLTIDLAVHLAPFNIYVNAILPGPIRTSFWKPIIKDIPGDKDLFFSELAKKEVPLQRIGTPDDIGGAALFLASELSSYVTGQTICVAGGQPLMPV